MLILNLGCGINRRRLYQEPFPVGTLHLDHNPDVKPDLVWDLNNGIPDGHTAYDGPEDVTGRWVPFKNNVDEIHAYHLIEHIGEMGKTDIWFRFWKSCWEALKPGGLMFAIAPYYLHESAVGDPTHTRLICKQTFHFLNRDSYKVKEGENGCAMSKLSIDFDLPRLDIRLQRSHEEDEFPSTIIAVLQARKTKDGGLVCAESKQMEAVS